MMIQETGYRPKQPFFELATEQYISYFRPSQRTLAQFYSFVISENAEKSVVAIPDGTIDIIFHCVSSKPQALIYGSVKKGTRVAFEKGTLYFGARFYPGKANQLLNCPMDQFTEKEVMLSDIRRNAKGLAERICTASSFDERVRLFEEFHNSREEKKASPALVSIILDRINRNCGDIRIQDIATETGYSTRFINNVFKQHVGIAPKLFSRIVRFQLCLNSLRHQHKKDFADLALEFGYYDQAHFINEFKEFSLFTPTQAINAGLHN